MKKRIAFRKLNRTSAHKWSMLRNMVSSLIEHERIVTTEAKAKELRHVADQMITLAKKGQPAPDNKSTPGELLQHRRRASRVVRGEWNVTKLFEILGPRYKFREGGYTRVMKLARPRAGDNAPMAVIEYVDRPGEIRAARPPAIFTTDGSDANAMRSMEEALRKMGIAPVEELVSESERESIEEELKAADEIETNEKASATTK